MGLYIKGEEVERKYENHLVQLSRPYMTTGKTIALTRWTLVDKAV